MENNKQTKYFNVSWQELHRDARALAWRLLSKKEWKGIAAITRGGLVPAAIVSRELDIRIIDTICVATYDRQIIGKPKLLKGIDHDGEGWLLIDDLVDTGTTAQIARDIFPKAHFATIYAKPEGRPLVDTFITEVSQDTWIQFPWDMVSDYSVPLAEQNS